ncbi:Rossmann fold nucleotide-binding protein Smf [Pediococcus damnosus]|uniref:DNA-processing protein DprA n=2 Tax=Pediococcus damnosus TaxID=51663 RepID=UPI00078C49AD|nr:DNA-processing protein DprA [Pediococcus damnosus]AMV61535.1 Rossmann fold nucleotide-binding protein Smf [Pediococcus damnosus]AMV65898.1 Rossmann fold nucleotide-binding protein Smf [Pediococcus damnosus]AMV70234.1 Rossmann fold nucleotide-binding protein Smf [Pediococcus damnosus]
MQIKEFLLKLHLCKGIGCHGETKFWKWWQHNYPKEQTCVLKPDQLIKFVSTQNRKQFLADFSSEKLRINVTRHWHQTKILAICDPEYPIQLKESYLPPIILFYEGELAFLRLPLLGMVGARLANQYGESSLTALMPTVVTQNIAVISGLAAGIDTMAHKSTLRRGGYTIGVIGTGLNRYYPKQNEALQKYMAIHQLILSEYPLDAGPQRYHFVERNRIIAGLCETLCVVQAKQHSGSLITANLALQNNRNVIAIPGRIDDILSVGCNELIAAGAKPVLNSQHIIEEFRFDRIHNMKYDY